MHDTQTDKTHRQTESARARERECERERERKEKGKEGRQGSRVGHAYIESQFVMKTAEELPGFTPSPPAHPLCSSPPSTSHPALPRHWSFSCACPRCPTNTIPMMIFIRPPWMKSSTTPSALRYASSCYVFVYDYVLYSMQYMYWYPPRYGRGWALRYTDACILIDMRFGE